jgi:hypothetical protein
MPPLVVDMVGTFIGGCGHEIGNVCVVAMVFEQVLLHPQPPPLPHIQMDHVVGCLVKWVMMCLKMLALRWLNYMTRHDHRTT